MVRSFVFPFVALLVSTSASASVGFGGIDAFHRKYADVQAYLRQVAHDFPQVAKVVDLGANDTGQRIQAIEIGSGPIHHLVVATHHGNEYGSTEVGLALVQSLAENPIAGIRMTVVPVLNASGYDKRVREELGKDPNRNYPNPCGSEGPFTLRSTKALADYLARENIAASATLHTYANMVLYPWGFATNDLKTEYDDLYIQLSKEAAAFSGYQVGNSNAALYPANGAYEDYAMLQNGVWSLLLEMGVTHKPNQAQIDQMIRDNVPGLRRFFAQAPSARAERHAFTGTCDASRGGRIDRHDE